MGLVNNKIRNSQRPFNLNFYLNYIKIILGVS